MEEYIMANQMFCFQCEQTAGCKACTVGAGVCGKKADTAVLQDKLTDSLIGLSHAAENNGDLITENTEQLYRKSFHHHYQCEF